jgi:3'(2'), 5'-bisphosphate nucleotidase
MLAGVIHRACATAKDHGSDPEHAPNVTSPSDITPDMAIRLVDDLTAIVARAATVIRNASPDTVLRRLKADNSTVTAADEASEAVILEGLSRLLPSVPVIAEESAASVSPQALGASFVVVDPLDGTREFLAGSDEFTVNLGIVTAGTPIAGVVASPMRGLVWRGVVGHGAERMRLLADGADQPQAIRTRRWPAQSAIAAVSRSHFDAATDALLARLVPVTRSPSGSAVKFCYVAEGSADIYPRLATTCEWDVAAGHALVAAAGGVIATPQGEALRYGRAAENYRVPAFIAWGDPAKAASATR